jgi:hypothetical protein
MNVLYKVPNIGSISEDTQRAPYEINWWINFIEPFTSFLELESSY